MRDKVKEYFVAITPEYDRWQKKNRYYHGLIEKLFRSLVPPGATVLSIGCGPGDMLASVKPGKGIGLGVNDELNQIAKARHPEFSFYLMELDRPHLPEPMALDYVILRDMLDYGRDIWEFVEHLKEIVTDDTVVVITTSNPLWAPVLRLASSLRLRFPESRRNFITNQDIVSILELQGLDVVEQGFHIFMPKYVPVLSTVLNVVVPHVPFLRQLCALQYIVAKRRRKPGTLSCSVIIPCHNEVDNIAECIRRVPRMGESPEILVVDDGSGDGTAEAVRKVMLEDDRVRLISYQPNRGKSHAVKTGLEAARGEALMVLDADMAVMPEDLPKFLQPLQNGTADFVNGTRLIYPMPAKAMRFMNFVGNKVFCLIVSWIIGQRCSDTLCGTKALLKRHAAKIQIGTERWGDFDLLFGAAALKLRMWDLPIHYQERTAGQSKMRPFREAKIFLGTCWRAFRRLRLSRVL